MKIKTIFTTFLIIGATFGVKAQTEREQRQAKTDSLLRIGRTECFMLKVDIESYLRKISTSADSLKEAHITVLVQAFPFLKDQIVSVDDLNFLCNNQVFRNKLISLAQDTIADYWKQKGVMIVLRHLSE